MTISSLVGSSNKWIEIASSSPTSGTTVSFTSVPEYKDLYVLAYGINNAGTTAQLTVRLNNDTGNNYSRNVLFFYSNTSRMEIANSSNSSSLYGTREVQAPAGFSMLIEGSNSPLKKITGVPYDGYGFETNGAWHSADVINRIDVISTATFSAGTIKLFGRN